MKKKLVAIFVAFVLTISLAACGAGKETTLTGMVVSVEGTVITLMEMDTGNMGGEDFAEGEMPEMPEGMEDFQGFGDWSPEDFEGTVPEGGNFPQWGDGEMPEGMELPEGMEGFEGMMPPEGMEGFEGMTPPEGMEGFEDLDPESFAGMMPGGGAGGGMDLSEMFSDEETQQLDIGEAHISVEIEGGKASGSMDDIKAGTFVTITMNGKGEVTNVLVSQQSFFGGGNRRPTN